MPPVLHFLLKKSFHLLSKILRLFSEKKLILKNYVVDSMVGDFLTEGSFELPMGPGFPNGS